MSQNPANNLRWPIGFRARRVCGLALAIVSGCSSEVDRIASREREMIERLSTDLVSAGSPVTQVEVATPVGSLIGLSLKDGTELLRLPVGNVTGVHIMSTPGHIIAREVAGSEHGARSNLFVFDRAKLTLLECEFGTHEHLSMIHGHEGVLTGDWRYESARLADEVEFSNGNVTFGLSSITDGTKSPHYIRLLRHPQGTEEAALRVEGVVVDVDHDSSTGLAVLAWDPSVHVLRLGAYSVRSNTARMIEIQHPDTLPSGDVPASLCISDEYVVVGVGPRIMRFAIDGLSKLDEFDYSESLRNQMADTTALEVLESGGRGYAIFGRDDIVVVWTESVLIVVDRGTSTVRWIRHAPSGSNYIPEVVLAGAEVLFTAEKKD